MADKKVVKKETNELVGIDFMADAGAGMEGADKDSFAIPYLRAIQKTSPQVDEADPAFMENAKAGMLINTVTNELFDGKEGVTFLPAHYQRRFLQWAPREDGGGFKGEFSGDDIAIMREKGEVTEDEDGRLMRGNDNVSDTRQHFGVLVAGDSPAQVLLSLKSTQIKKSKQLMSMMSAAKVKTGNGALVTPPTWMNMIKVSTVLESNDQGSWYGYKFESAGFLSDPELYAFGKDFHETCKAGEVKINYAEEGTAEAKTVNSGKF